MKKTRLQAMALLMLMLCMLFLTACGASAAGQEETPPQESAASAETEEQVVFGNEDYFVKTDTELKNTIQWIIPNAQKNIMEPILLTLEKGGSTYPDTPHEGEEFGYVLQGSVMVHVGSRSFRARKGESFYFTPDKKHYLTSKSGAVLIWVSSPPSF